MIKVLLTDVPSVSINSVLILAKLFGRVFNIEKIDNGYELTYLSLKPARKLKEIIKFKLPNSKITISSLNTLFIDRIPKEIKMKTIKEYLTKFGKLNKLEILREYYIYKVILVEYLDRESAKTCLEQTNRKYKFREEDEAIVVKYFNPSQVVKDNLDDKCVFIYNLKGVTSEELKEHFLMYGSIKSCGVNGNKGFVNYSNDISALKAVKYGDKSELKGNKICVMLKSTKKTNKK